MHACGRTPQPSVESEQIEVILRALRLLESGPAVGVSEAEQDASRARVCLQIWS